MDMRKLVGRNVRRIRQELLSDMPLPTGLVGKFMPTSAALKPCVVRASVGAKCPVLIPTLLIAHRAVMLFTNRE